MKEIKIGDVIETMCCYLITNIDKHFIYAREIKSYIALGKEFILFTKKNIEKEYYAIRVKNVIDMNEVTRRYLELT